jgi:hypothetical protein
MLSRLITTVGLIAGLYPAAAVAAERPIVVELYPSRNASSRTCRRRRVRPQPLNSTASSPLPEMAGAVS